MTVPKSVKRTLCARMKDRALGYQKSARWKQNKDGLRSSRPDREIDRNPNTAYIQII